MITLNFLFLLDYGIITKTLGCTTSLEIDIPIIIIELWKWLYDAILKTTLTVKIQ